MRTTLCHDFAFLYKGLTYNYYDMYAVHYDRWEEEADDNSCVACCEEGRLCLMLLHIRQQWRDEA